MVTLDQIRKPIAEDLKQFDKFVAEQFRADTPLMSEMLTYALSTRGKSVRPLIVMLCAALNSATGLVSRRAWVSSMMVEMIHLASLIHDDVIDDADTRRAKPTLNAKWQSRKAVLTGDYILGRTLTVGMSSGQYDLVSHISRAIAILCEGEVVQADFADKHEMTREGYLDIIYKKTASLISISASAGALSAGAPHEKVDMMRRYGEAIGMAFQIQDDIIDYMPSSKSGKPSLNDLREGKITLPLLAVLEKADEQKRAHIVSLLERCSHDDDAMDEIQTFVREGGGIEFAQEVAHAYIGKASEILSRYPESPIRTSLMNLSIFIMEREY